jgi:dihydrofolate reductase
MTEIILIAAVADNNAIGKDGRIPWHIKEDFQHFKSLTMGNACLMGDKTYDSLPTKPLPGRENIVITLNPAWLAPGAKVFHSLEEALDYCKDKEKLYICGGASVYRLTLPLAHKLEITRVHQSPDGDTFFPEIDLNTWKIVAEEKHDGYTFQTFNKK